MPLDARVTASLVALAAVLQYSAPVLEAQTAPLVWPKPDLFWYRKAVEGGHLWLKVDARHGVREPLFDHQRLAIELTLRTGVEYTPLTLPFADPAAGFVVKYDGSNAYIQEGAMAVEFILGGQQWRCDLQIKWDWNRVPPTDYECLPRRPAGPTAPTIGPGDTKSDTRLSPDGRWVALVDRGNVAVRSAAGGAAIRLSTDGTAGYAYEAGSLQWSADSKTVSAFRVNSDVWSSNAVAGSVKPLVSRGQWDVAASGTKPRRPFAR